MTPQSLRSQDHGTAKVCWRCGAGFGCGAGTGACWCNDLPPIGLIDEASDCLCPACLDREVSSRYPGWIAAAERPALVENEDYYVEGPAIVFTARYHLRRGYCCDSGCRHCPYKEQNGGRD